VGEGFVVPLQLDQTVAGHLVAAPARDDAAADLVAMHHVAMLATLELANIHRAWEADRRQGAGLLSELLHGGTTPELATEQMRDLRIRDGLMVAVVAVSDPADDTRVSNRLYDRDVAHLQLRLGGRLWFLVAESELGDLVDSVRSAEAVGISSVFAVETPFQRPQREASWALERSRAGGGQPLVFSSHVPSLRWLPAESAVLEHLIEDILGPITTYDRTHTSSLEETLRVYLELNRRPSDAAEAMHCHRHTLLYRLRRIEELTDRDLRRTADVVDFWLAFEARTALISGGTVAPPELADAPTEQALSGQPST
jgi:purine catabolism regulator